MQKQNNIPQLRFPDFQEEWEIKKLGNLFFNRRQKGNITLSIFSVTQDRGLVPRNSLERRMANDAAPENNLMVESNDLVYNMMRMWQGAIGIAVQKCMVSPAYIVLKPLANVNSLFFLYYFERAKSKYYFTSYSYGLTSDRLRLYYKDFSDIKFHIPLLKEQNHIADFINVLDKKISQLKNKKKILEQYKKGIMQKIFSHELRFKDENGKEFPKWNKKKFGEVYSFKSTNSFSRDNLNYESGEIKNIHYGDIHTKFQLQFDITKELVPFINNEIPINKISVNTYCIEGDLVIADASEDYADVGKSIELLNLNHEKVLAGLHTILARPDLTIMSIGFGGFIMKSSSVRDQIKIIAQGIKVLSISAVRLAGIEFELPSKKEQTKIANFLSAIDNKINHTQTQLQQTEQYKKGLLEKMFV